MDPQVSKIYNRAVQLARLTKSANKTNPKVGCVLFQSSNILISEGYHKTYGSDHAERMAFNHCKEKEKINSDTQILITLEPCNHHGKTPPCLDLIVKNKIKNTIVAATDPHPLMRGKSLDILHSKNLSYQCIADNAEALALLESFVINQKHQRPFIRLKIALDKEGVYADESKRLIITDACSQFFSHQLRAHSNAILVGWKTVLQDNPTLNNRLAGGDSPLRVVIDRGHKLPHSQNIFHDAQPLLYVSPVFRSDLPEEVGQFSPEGNGKEWLLSLMHHLCQNLQVGTLLVEGGGKTLDYFIQAALWDELYVFQSPLNSQAHKPLYFALPFAQLSQTIALVKDKVHIYKPQSMGESKKLLIKS
jgi:diaminohydroxyphosphoribosylaminopyrimidine deaminase / 5-amino-6-(5-phosphoribosylamino)uracil reductase